MRGSWARRWRGRGHGRDAGGLRRHGRGAGSGHPRRGRPGGTVQRAGAGGPHALARADAAGARGRGCRSWRWCGRGRGALSPGRTRWRRWRPTSPPPGGQGWRAWSSGPVCPTGGWTLRPWPAGGGGAGDGGGAPPRLRPLPRSGRGAGTGRRLGVTRILTSGGQARAEDGLPLIARLIAGPGGASASCPGRGSRPRMWAGSLRRGRGKSTPPARAAVPRIRASPPWASAPPRCAGPKPPRRRAEAAIAALSSLTAFLAVVPKRRSRQA